MRNDVLSEQLDRAHDVGVLNPPRLHQAQDAVDAGLGVALDLADARVRIAGDDHILPIEGLGAQALAGVPFEDGVSLDELRVGLGPAAVRLRYLQLQELVQDEVQVPQGRLSPALLHSLSVGLGAVGDGEDPDLVVGLGAGGRPVFLSLPVAVDVGLHLLDAEHQREAESSDAVLGGEVPAIGAGAGQPDGRMRLLDRLGDHVPLGNLEVAAVVREAVGGPHLRDDAQGLLPHGPRLVRRYFEPALLVQPRPAGAELDAASAHDVQRSDPLGDSNRVVEGVREQHHAVADSNALGPLRHRRQEDLRRR